MGMIRLDSPSASSRHSGGSERSLDMDSRNRVLSKHQLDHTVKESELLTRIRPATPAERRPTCTHSSRPVRCGMWHMPDSGHLRSLKEYMQSFVHVIKEAAQKARARGVPDAARPALPHSLPPNHHPDDRYYISLPLPTV